MTKNSVPAQTVLWRSLIGCVGGYYYSMLLAVFIACLRDASRAEAVITGVLFGFSAHAAIILCAFAVKSPGRLLCALSISAALMLAFIVSSGRLGHV